jgi:hypothetical protein
MRRIALAVFAAVLVAGAWHWFKPALQHERRPSAGMGAGIAFIRPVPIPLAGGSEVCVDAQALDPATQVARFGADAKRPAPALRVSTGGPGYTGAPVTLPGGWAGRRQFEVPIQPPPRSLFGKLCVRNLGHRRVGLLGTIDRTSTREQVLTDGKVTPGPDLILDYVERRPRSLASTWPRIARHAATLKGFFVGPWFLWLVLAAVVVGVPGGIVVAVRSALRD